MPISRYQIRNEYSLAAPELYQSADRDDPEAILEGVAMAGLVGVLRQLGDLAEFAAEIFHDLHEEVMATAARGHALMIRVQQVEAEFPSVEKALLSRTSHSHFAQNAGVEWHANLQLDQNLITSGDLPRFIMDSYEECRGPPRLFSLDKFDVAGAGACLKRYTDPSFYKTELAYSKKPKAEIQRETKARKIKKKGARWRNGDTPDIFSTSHFNSILNQLASDDNNSISEKVPIHGVKLKRRHLNGSSFNSRTGRSYMERILETDPPKHDILLQDSLHDTHELAPTMREISMEYLSSKQLQLVRSQISSPDRQEVLESSLDEFEQDIIKERILKSVPEEIPEVELEKIPSTFHQMGKSDTLIDVARTNEVVEFGVENVPISGYQMEQEDELINGECKMAADANGYGHDENVVEKISSPLVKLVEKDSVVDSKRKRAVSSDGYRSVESEAEKIHSTFQPVDQKSMLLDSGRKIEASDDGYASGDATSEMENFMDALTTMESELDTDTETRAKHERTFFHVASQGMDSDTNEEHRHLPVQCSDDCLVGNCGTLCDWNSSHKKQRTSSSDMDTLGNSADVQMPKGKEIASFHMHEKSRNSFKLEGALSGSSYDDPLFMSADKSTNGDAAAEAYLSTNALLAEIHDKSPEKLTSSCGGLGTEPPDYLVPTKTGNEVSVSPYLVSELVEASSSPFITDEVATIIHSSPRASFHDIPLVGTDVTEISSPKTEETGNDSLLMPHFSYARSQIEVGTSAVDQCWSAGQRLDSGVHDAAFDALVHLPDISDMPLAVDDVLQATDIINLPSRTTNDTILEEVTEGDDKDSAAEHVTEETQDSPDLKTFQMEENLFSSVNQDLDACTDSKLTPECLASDVNSSDARQDCSLVEMQSGILPIDPLDFQKAGDIVEHEHQKISSRALHKSESFDADFSESHVADLAEAPTARPGMLSVEPEELFDSLEHGVTDGTDDTSGPMIPDSLVNVLPAEVPTNPNDLVSRRNNAASESVIHGPTTIFPEASDHHVQLQNASLSSETASDHRKLESIESQESHIGLDDQGIAVFGLSDNHASQTVVGPTGPIAEPCNSDSTEPVSSEWDDHGLVVVSPQASDDHVQLQEECLVRKSSSDHQKLEINESQGNHIGLDDQRITVFGLSDNDANQAVVGPTDPNTEPYNPDSTEPVSSGCGDCSPVLVSPEVSNNHEQVQEEYLSGETASDHHELAITGSQENHIEFNDQQITVFSLSDNDANQAVVGPTDPIAESHNPDSTEPVSSECDDQGRVAASPQASDNHEQLQEECLLGETASDHHKLAITESPENHIGFKDQRITFFDLSDNDTNQAVVGPTDPIAEPHNPDSTEPVSSECDDQGPVAASPEAYDNHEQLQEVCLSGETASDHHGLATTESQENRIGFDDQRITVFGLSEHDANQAVVGPTDLTAEPCNPESPGPVSSEFANHVHHPVSFVDTQVDPNAGSDSSTSFMGGDQELEQKLCDQVLQPKAPEHTHPRESVKDATSPSTCFLPEPTVPLDQGCKLEDREEIDAVSSHEEEQGLECFNFRFERKQSLKEMDHQVLEPFSSDQSHHHEDEKDAASSSTHFLPEPVVPQEQSHELESREKLNLVSLHEKEQGLEYSELHFERTLSVNEIDSQVLELKSLDRTEPCENEKDASSPSTHLLPEPVPHEQNCELEAGIELNMVCSHQEEEACRSFGNQSERDQSPKEMDTPLACEDNHLNVLEHSSVDHLGLQPSVSKVQSESHLVVTSGVINGSGITSANSPVCTSSNPEACIKLPADHNCEASESPLSSFDSNISAASSQICPSIDPLVPVAAHEMSCKLQLSRPFLGFPLTSPNLLNGDLVDMPPLPPLPPLEWRIGKLRHGSVSFGGEHSHPMNPCLPSHRPEDENPQQPIRSFLPLQTVEEHQPQQPLNPSGPLPTTEDEKTQHVSLTLGRAMEPLKTVPLVQTKEDEKPQHAAQTLAASGTLPLQTVEDYQPQQLLNPFGLLPTTEDEKTQNVSLTLRCEIVQPPKTIPPVQTKEDEKPQHSSQSLGGEMEQPLKLATALPIVEDGKPKEDEKPQHASQSLGGEMEQPLKSATTLPIIEDGKPKEDEKPQHASQTLGGEMEQPLKSATALPIVEDGKPKEDEKPQHASQSLGGEMELPLKPSAALLIVEDGKSQHGLFRFDGLLGEPLNPFIPPQAAEEEKPNESIKSVLNRPRNPLIDAVAAHDRSMLRKASERIRPEIKPMPDERDSLLEQIRTKSFNLKPAASAKPVIQGPKTNLNVVAILEKANAIRQAFAGSDEDDDSDSWE